MHSHPKGTLWQNRFVQQGITINCLETEESDHCQSLYSWVHWWSKHLSIWIRLGNIHYTYICICKLVLLFWDRTLGWFHFNPHWFGNDDDDEDRELFFLLLRVLQVNLHKSIENNRWTKSNCTKPKPNKYSCFLRLPGEDLRLYQTISGHSLDILTRSSRASCKNIFSVNSLLVWVNGRLPDDWCCLSCFWDLYLPK